MHISAHKIHMHHIFFNILLSVFCSGEISHPLLGMEAELADTATSGELAIMCNLVYCASQQHYSNNMFISEHHKETNYNKVIIQFPMET